mmetsp:Transcript_63822/g.121714  ORF Transcript_63822/g.121714 Transcript_63822/m.121714 type:complete len:238 (+) Transcript_63822:443-1156(+)
MPELSEMSSPDSNPRVSVRALQPASPQSTPLSRNTTKLRWPRTALATAAAPSSPSGLSDKANVYTTRSSRPSPPPSGRKLRATASAPAGPIWLLERSKTRKQKMPPSSCRQPTRHSARIEQAWSVKAFPERSNRWRCLQRCNKMGARWLRAPSSSWCRTTCTSSALNASCESPDSHKSTAPSSRTSASRGGAKTSTILLGRHQALQKAQRKLGLTELYQRILCRLDRQCVAHLPWKP